MLDGSRDGVLNAADAQVERLKAYWLYRIVYGPDPLREKMTLFWHGHFATSNRKVQNVERMLAQNELFRRQALGDFRELATAILSDPAMLVWLDGVGNSKEKPNENLAREFLELFTLGVGHYTEADIRQAARALTGWLKEGGEGDYEARIRFDPARFDGGVEDVPRPDRTMERGRHRADHARAAGGRRPPRPQAVSLLRPRRRRAEPRADRPAGRSDPLARLLDPPHARRDLPLAAFLLRRRSPAPDQEPGRVHRRPGPHPGNPAQHGSTW